MKKRHTKDDGNDVILGFGVFALLGRRKARHGVEDAEDSAAEDLRTVVTGPNNVTSFSARFRVRWTRDAASTVFTRVRNRLGFGASYKRLCPG